MALTAKRAAFFDVDNTLIRGSTLYFLGKGKYQRGYFTKKDISRFVLANLRFRLTGKENREEIQSFQDAATDFIGGHSVDDILKIAQEIYDQYVSPALWQGTIDLVSYLRQGAFFLRSRLDAIALRQAVPRIAQHAIHAWAEHEGALG